MANITANSQLEPANNAGRCLISFDSPGTLLKLIVQQHIPRRLKPGIGELVIAIAAGLVAS